MEIKKSDLDLTLILGRLDCSELEKKSVSALANQIIFDIVIKYWIKLTFVVDKKLELNAKVFSHFNANAESDGS